VAEEGGAVAPVGVRGSGILSSGMELLGIYGDTVLRNPSTSCQYAAERISKSLVLHHSSGLLFFPQRGGFGKAIPFPTR
jgi:hypothetical protein